MKYERIRQLREDMDLTQDNLAKKLNLTQRTYARYEANESNIPLEVLNKIADYYNVSTDYLLNRTNKKEPYPNNKKN